ncbi:3-oxoacyl-synthase 2 [Thozetella sp. PMI_491]|nr:3-oxoacyl-synthase 2 [Thozetella sp. PMI_491]
MRRVVVTGLGAITPFGVGARHSWHRLIAGESGITSVAAFEPVARWKGLASTVSGIVPTGDQPGEKWRWRPLDWLDATAARRMPKFAQYAVAATEMALTEARWKPTEAEDCEMTGVCLGSGIGNMNETYDTVVGYEKDGRKKVSPWFSLHILIASGPAYVAQKYGLQGPNHATTTACTTGAHSIIDAARIIADGEANVMVAGGAESCINPLAFEAFGRSKSLSVGYNHDPPASCRPFDQDRGGFVISEGAAVLVLEELEHARARGTPILAELRGFGDTEDAYHMTAPRPDGSGALRAMKRALKRAGIRPSQVDYINAHATGTRIGDAAEVTAIRAMMLGEDGVADESLVTVSGTKSATGHLLGAAGAVEAVFSVLALSEGIIPPTLNLDTPDVGPNFNFVPHRAQEKDMRVVMSNSFGFGGTNASLVFSKLE